MHSTKTIEPIYGTGDSLDRLIGPRVHIQDMESGAAFDLRAARSANGYHQVFDRRDQRWHRVQLRVVVAMRNGEMETVMMLVKLPEPEPCITVDSVQRHIDVLLRNKDQRHIDVLLRNKDAGPSDIQMPNMGRKRSERKAKPRCERTPKAKPRHAERREQLAQQRAHGRRHNGR